MTRKLIAWVRGFDWIGPVQIPHPRYLLRLPLQGVSTTAGWIHWWTEWVYIRRDRKWIKPI